MAFWLVPLIIGTATVLQGGLNRKIADVWGLPSAVLLNALVYLVIALGFYYLVRVMPSSYIPEPVRPRAGFLSNFELWYLLPGLLGFTIVVGIPLAIPKLGALPVFVGIVAAQMAASLLWDMTVEKTPISMIRALAAIITVLGAALTFYDRA